MQNAHLHFRFPMVSGFNMKRLMYSHLFQNGTKAG